MAWEEHTAHTTSEIKRTGVHSQFQAIDAHYYNITDAEAWPVAGLLLLLDGKGQPVRAELHLYEDLPSHVHEAAVRQSRLLLQERYFSPEPLPLRILQTYQQREAMNVRLPATGTQPMEAQGEGRRRYLLIGIAVAAVAIAAIWGIFTFSGASELSLRQSSAPPTAALPDQIAVPMQAAESRAGEVNQSNAAPFPNAELPPSINARNDIGIGVRVRILPTMKLTLRSEPGPEAGVEVGYMQESAEATVIGGPVMTRGDRDTIVWWYVQLDNGLQAWAAANTSDFALLEPVR
jgi:hypothetical protein